MAHKKIVFVIVEGPSDHDALSLVLNRLFDQQTVHVHIIHRDITTDQGVDPSNIVTKIANEVKQFANSSHFQSSHFQEIIHLVDMDGAYISNEAVVEDLNAEHPIYSITEIRTADKSRIEQRNLQKRNNLDRLLTTKAIWKIPYSVYYMSCNLDHALYDKLNTSDEDKENDAHTFAKQYKDNAQGFLEYISKSDFAVMDGYKESWAYIKNDLHSLERHTNLGLCFIRDQAIQDSHEAIKREDPVGSSYN